MRPREGPASLYLGPASTKILSGEVAEPVATSVASRGVMITLVNLVPILCVKRSL